MNEKIPYDLLARYFARECPEGEIAWIEKWRMENPANKKVFTEFAEIWNHSQTGDLNFNPDTANALAEVNKKIGLEEIQSSISDKQRSIVYYAVRIAAVLVISLVVWYGYNKIDEKEKWITIENNGKGIKDLVLADGTKITLNCNGIIKYPAKFSKATRNVELDGEAYFEVAKNPDKPFIISAQNSVTKVLGTAFNLRARADEDNVILTVAEGKVAFSTTKVDKILTVNLEAGERGILNKVTNSVTEVKNDDANFMAWKTGRLLFDSAPLKKVAEDLSGFYNIKFQVENHKYDSVKVTINFEQNSLEEVIEAMEFLQFQFIKTGQGYLIKQKQVK